MRLGWRILVALLSGALLSSFTITQAQTDLLKNGSFETDSDGDGIPDFWRGHNLGLDDQVVPGGVDGARAFQFVGQPGINKALRQTVRGRIPAGTHFVWEALSDPEGDYRSGGLYALKLKLFFTDDTTYEETAGFKSGSGGWEGRRRSLDLPKSVKRFIISVVYNDHNADSLVLFDAVRVIIE